MWTIKATTFNVKRSVFASGTGSWMNRGNSVAQIIKNISPDILGTQELINETLSDLSKNLPMYGVCGIGRRGQTRGEYTAIFYKKSVFDLIESSTFWLSKSPDIPSRSWLALLPRICTVANLVHKESGKEIVVYNTHLDNLSRIARYNSLRLIKSHIDKQISAFPNTPIIFMGDFNSKFTHKSLKSLLEPSESDSKVVLLNSYDLFDNNELPLGRSFNGFILGKYSRNLPIDYIFISNHFKLIDISFNKDKINNLYPSDHFPVTSTLSLF